MSVEILTKEDLHIFKKQLLTEIKALLQEMLIKEEPSIEGYRTRDVRKLLGCCYNKLITLRITKKIRAKKIMGTWYYNKEDVKKLLTDGFK